MNHEHTYAMPIFPIGSGLGNRLFHWCDAKIYSYKNNTRFVSPRWCRLSLGKHLRQWKEGRLLNEPLIEYAYAFRRLPTDISYKRGLLEYLFSPKLRLSRSPDLITKTHPPRGIILFDKSEYRFNGYGSYRHRLKKELIESIQPTLLKRVLDTKEPYIGIHARLGDGFTEPEPGIDGFTRTGWLQQTPVQWFKETLQLVRKITGVNYKAYVFSDGTKDQLKPLLDETNTFLSPHKNAVIDLLSLSRSWVILGSGSSSFSAFATFLGSSHAFTAPGHPFSNRGLIASPGQVVGSLNPRDDGAGDWIQTLARPDSRNSSYDKN